MTPLLVCMGYLGFRGYSEGLYPFGALPPKDMTGKAAYAILMLAVASNVFWLLHKRMQRIERMQDWHINAVNVHIHSLSEYMREIAEHTYVEILEPPEHGGNAENVEVVETPLPAVGNAKASGKPYSHWPWGNHHTATLGHLEAAARHFWTLYDPDDIGTAPTNEMVASWLQDERGISKEKARAIASMLRPDGLPTGPRR